MTFARTIFQVASKARPLLHHLRFGTLSHASAHSTAWRMTSKKALIAVVDGMEEMECVITADVLRRAEIEVTLAGVSSRDSVKCSRNIVIVPDAALSEVQVDTFDALILPGGLGAAKFFAGSAQIGTLLKKAEESGKVIAVICASPIALASHGIAGGKSLTSHPSVAGQLTALYKYSEERVVVDGHLITSRGPGTAFEFALAIVKQLVGQEKVDAISPGMILK